MAGEPVDLVTGSGKAAGDAPHEVTAEAPDQVAAAPRFVTRTPVVALVGRPNVGKSTLFNRLTRSRNALVADVPGLTRDRHYGQARVGEGAFIVIDTGGFEPIQATGIAAQMVQQARQAILEADLVLLMVDGRAGLTPQDQDIAAELRRRERPIAVGSTRPRAWRAKVAAEFHELGMGELHPISAAHGQGIRSWPKRRCR